MKITRWCQQRKTTSIEVFQRKLLLYTKSFFYLLCFHVWKFFKDFPFLQNIVWIKITQQMAHASKNVENRARKAAVLNCGFVIYIYIYRSWQMVQKFRSFWLGWKKRNASERFHPSRKTFWWYEQLMINDERSKPIMTSTFNTARATCLTVYFFLQGIRMGSLHTWKQVNANRAIM